MPMELEGKLMYTLGEVIFFISIGLEFKGEPLCLAPLFGADIFDGGPVHTDTIMQGVELRLLSLKN